MSNGTNINCAQLKNTRLTDALLLEEFLGSGSFGCVFLAGNVVEDRRGMGDLAVKVIFPNDHPKIRQTQLAELLVLPHIKHESILSAHIAGEAEIALNGDPKQKIKVFYLVMELADRDGGGRPINLQTALDALAKAPALSPQRLVLAREVGLGLAAALAYLSQRPDHPVHRDIKPENVMRVNGRWKLADFGLVSLLDEETYRRSTTAMGTYLYMPPESYDGKRSQAWDMWSLGVVLAEILTGHVPFDGTWPEVMKKVLEGAPDLGRAQLPVPFRRIIAGCLMRDSTKRLQASQALRLFDAQPSPGKTDSDKAKKPLWPGALMLFALVAALAFGMSQTGLVDFGSRQKEREIYEEAKRIGTAKGYQVYLSQFPQGQYAGFAKAAIDMQPGDEPQRTQAAAESARRQAETRRQEEELARQKRETQAAAQREAELRPGKVFKDCADCPEMVVMPAGNFQMGSDNGDSDEKPLHAVTIGKPFALGKTEVTQAQWKAVMGSAPPELYFKSCGADCPVERVSWNDAQEFIKKLNAKTGKQYRLPSEAEWEYACRAGGSHAYCGGNDLDALAWYDKNSGNTTHPVARKQANAYGLYDMSGNVWEWVEDCYHDSYSGAPNDGSAWTSGKCDVRVLRGGSWSNEPVNARSASRSWIVTSDRYVIIGFRLARMLP